MPAPEPSGRVVFDLSYATVDPALHGLAIHRAAIFHALWQAVAVRRIPIETGVEIAALATPMRRSAVPWSPATAAAWTAVDLVVDATGGRLGAAAALRRSGAAAPLCLWRGLGHGAGSRAAARPAGAALPQRAGDDRPAAGRPCAWRRHAEGDPVLEPEGGGASGAAGRRDRAVAAPGAGPLAGDRAGRSRGITDPAQLTLARYTQATLRRPYGERIAFIGDAAHSHQPPARRRGDDGDAGRRGPGGCAGRPRRDDAGGAGAPMPRGGAGMSASTRA